MLELLVVGLIMSVLSVLVMQFARPMVHTVLTLRDRAYSTNELRMLTQSMLQDVGGAEKVKALASVFHIEREDQVLVALGLWSGSKDKGVDYSLTGTDVHRVDREANTDTIVAQRIVAFDVQRQQGLGVTATITTGTDTSERTVELAWSY